jgi:hypothetical protein
MIPCAHRLPLYRRQKMRSTEGLTPEAVRRSRAGQVDKTAVQEVMLKVCDKRILLLEEGVE